MRQYTENNKMKCLEAADLDIKLQDEERLILTDNGAYDLEKQGMEGYYVWIGYRHGKGVNARKMLDKMVEFMNCTVVPAIMKKFNVAWEDVVRENFYKTTDMFRVYVEVQG